MIMRQRKKTLNVYYGDENMKTIDPEDGLNMDAIGELTFVGLYIQERLDNWEEHVEYELLLDENEHPYLEFVVEHYEDASDLIYAAVNGSDFDHIREIREGVQQPTPLSERIISAIFVTIMMTVIRIRSFFRFVGRVFGRRPHDVAVKDFQG